VAARFAGKAAVVTGAARGIGACVAADLAAEGASVLAVDVDAAALPALRDAVAAAGGTCLTAACDVSRRADVDRAVAAALEAFGRVDILVNNAGILLNATIEETGDEMIDRVLDVNLKSVLYAIRAVTPVMKRQRYGRIVNVSSITGKNGDRSTTMVYGASKGAIMTLTRSVARQLGPWNVTCNAVAPHAIMTDLMKHWDGEKRRTAAEEIPVRRLGTVEDVSRLMLFLASDEASYVTGETINCNGGYYMD
jgi:3-oxoacyl-[acyl-carrier protein] reductase